MTKVCILTSVHPPFDTRIFHKEAKSLVMAGHDVTLIAQHDKEEVVDGIRIVPLSKPKDRIQRMTKTVWQLYRKARKIDADVYHFHDPELIPIGIMLKCNGKKVIYDVHEDVPEQILSKQYIPTYLKRMTAITFNSFEKNLSRAFDHIVTVTDTITGKFLRYNKNVSTVKNYISKNIAKEITCTDYPQGNGYSLIFTGAIYSERGILEAVKALNLIADIKINFILCGPVEQDYFQKIISEDKNRRIMYKGTLSYNEVLKEIARADIGYICDYPLKRHMEGLPVKLFEYMALGVPMVVSDFPVWNNIVCEAQCGLTLNPLNPEDIAYAIRYLIEHEDDRRRMGENGRRAIIEKYNWETEAKKMLTVYKSVEEYRK